MQIGNIIKSLTPPIVLQHFRKFTSPNDNVYKGNYKKWNDVVSVSTGFNDTAIFEKVRASASQVRDGKAAYERDSVIFNQIIYSWPVLTCLQNVALGAGHLHVIDFGGSLGTSYFQNRLFLKNISSLKWFIVEQRHYVDCGKKEFEDEHLKFEYAIENVHEYEKIDCMLISGSIQYFEQPEEWFIKLQSYGFDYIIFDRISFIKDNIRLTLQVVPKQIYPASFPCWFFNEEEFLGSFSKEYNLITDFDSADKSIFSSDHKKMYWKGFFFKKRKL